MKSRAAGSYMVPSTGRVSDRIAAFGRGRGQEQVGYRQNADIAADEHQAHPLAGGEERPAAVQKRVEGYG